MSQEIAFLPFCPIRFYPSWNGPFLAGGHLTASYAISA